MSTVLVTGGSGFIAGHCIRQLLAAGHRVQTTIRHRRREQDVRGMLKAAGVDAGDDLVCVEADLAADGGWADAAAGCEYVLHVASPFPADTPQHEDELILPAREGALRVLRAARNSGARRVVLTSSFAAVGYGREARTAPFTEADWTRLDKDLSAYAKSKTLAERAAWNFMAREGGALELAVVNPVAVFGPPLNSDYATSILLLKRMLDGALPGCPQLYFGVVDVRDVADLHLRAMTHPAARGERFLAVAGASLSVRDIAKVLKVHLGDAARRVSTRQLPNWLVRTVAWRNREVRQILPELGKVKNASSDKARVLLGWNPRSGEEAILAAARVLLGLQASPS